MDLPLEAPAEGLYWSPRTAGHRMLITGAAGAVASLVSEGLSKSYDLIGLDNVPIEDPHFVETHQIDLGDVTAVARCVQAADFVLHLATGVAGGKTGLQAVEIDATNRMLATAVTSGTRRVMLASSNHVGGWHEREWLAGRGTGQVKPSDPPRPDGLYGVAKAAMEALGRFASDAAGLPVSVLRIGTMRKTMTLQELIDSDELPYLGFGQQREERLRRTWLTGEDLVDIIEEELAAPEPYRLRYVTSSPDQDMWDHTVYTG